MDGAEQKPFTALTLSHSTPKHPVSRVTAPVPSHQNPPVVKDLARLAVDASVTTKYVDTAHTPIQSVISLTNRSNFKGWNTRERSCDKVRPSQINTKGLTHLYYAFVFFHPTTFEIVPMNDADIPLYKEFTDLKTNKLQTWVAIGGVSSVPAAIKYICAN